MLVVVLSAVAGLMGLAGVLEQLTSVQSTADQGAAKAMQRITLEVREAKRVQIVASHQFRVYYPVVVGTNRYDRFQEDTNNYVEFVQGDSRGVASTSGTYLWRKTASGDARIITKDLYDLAVSSTSPHSVIVTVHVRRQSGSRYGDTRLTNRVLYLRNS